MKNTRLLESEDKNKSPETAILRDSVAIEGYHQLLERVMAIEPT